MDSAPIQVGDEISAAGTIGRVIAVQDGNLTVSVTSQLPEGENRTRQFSIADVVKLPKIDYPVPEMGDDRYLGGVLIREGYLFTTSDGTEIRIVEFRGEHVIGEAVDPAQRGRGAFSLNATDIAAKRRDNRR